MTLAADNAHPRHRNWRAAAAEALAGTGVHASRPVHANLTAPALVAEAVSRHEGRLSADGALVVATGVHTGRSAQDKFVVDEPSVTGEVWWGRVNNRLAPEKFAVLKARVQAYLQGQELFTQDLYAGADPAHRVRVRMVTTGAWQSLFSRNIFIRPRPEELAGFQPDYVILHAPHFQTDPGDRRRTQRHHHRVVVRAADHRDRRQRVRRRGEEVDLHRDELDPARPRRDADALQRQYRRRRRCRAVLRPVRHRQDYPIVGSASQADRRR